MEKMIDQLIDKHTKRFDKELRKVISTELRRIAKFFPVGPKRVRGKAGKKDDGKDIPIV